MSEVDAGGGRGDSHSEGGATDSGVTRGDAVAARTLTKSGTAAALNYDSVKYTLVVDQHARLELVRLQDCLHGNNEHNDDSDTETVYQSANEEEDPEDEEERKRSEEARNQGNDEVSFLTCLSTFPSESSETVAESLKNNNNCFAIKVFVKFAISG